MDKLKKVGLIALVVVGTLGALSLLAPEAVKSKLRL